MPRHIAIVMDGNGRWAHDRGRPRTDGHRAGEAALMDVLHGAIELGVSTVSAYAFSTENWRRSPEEVRFLMGFKQGRHPAPFATSWPNSGCGSAGPGGGQRLCGGRLSTSSRTPSSSRTRTDRLTLQFCVNYGGRAEIADAARALARDVVAGQVNVNKIDETVLARYLDEPACPTSTCSSARPVSSARSNFMLWQSAYAEFVFVETPVARLRPAGPLGCLPDLRQARPPLRRGRTGRTTMTRAHDDAMISIVRLAATDEHRR